LGDMEGGKSRGNSREPGRSHLLLVGCGASSVVSFSLGLFFLLMLVWGGEGILLPIVGEGVPGDRLGKSFGGTKYMGGSKRLTKRGYQKTPQFRGPKGGVARRNNRPNDMQTQERKKLVFKVGGGL